mmetsp:Transcript_5550/g.19273  ORF Transcript_5550/g.19273 Transcript_5550/m.19273 type:complete len:141 (-) Transcript_5550:76-498(-)
MAERLPAVGLAKTVSSSVSWRGFNYTLPHGHAEIISGNSSPNRFKTAWDFHERHAMLSRTSRSVHSRIYPSRPRPGTSDFPARRPRTQWGPPPTNGGHHTSNWWHGADTTGGWVELSHILQRKNVSPMRKPTNKRLPTLC